MTPIHWESTTPSLPLVGRWNHQSAVSGRPLIKITAATTPEKLKRGEFDLWDSGQIDSSQSLGVPYGGATLHSGERVYWNVRVWDREGKPSACPKPAWWEMGLLEPADWQAAWITQPKGKPLTEKEIFDNHPAPLFRKEFALEKKIRRARVYVSGLGYYELYLNGKRVGDQRPGPRLDHLLQTVLSTRPTTSRANCSGAQMPSA